MKVKCKGACEHLVQHRGIELSRLCLLWTLQRIPPHNRQLKPLFSACRLFQPSQQEFKVQKASLTLLSKWSFSVELPSFRTKDKGRHSNWRKWSWIPREVLLDDFSVNETHFTEGDRKSRRLGFIVLSVEGMLAVVTIGVGIACLQQLKAVFVPKLLHFVHWFWYCFCFPLRTPRSHGSEFKGFTFKFTKG